MAYNSEAFKIPKFLLLQKKNVTKYYQSTLKNNY